VEPSSTWVDVVYAQHLLDLYNSGNIANAAVFPSVLGAQSGDPRARYSNTALRPWFVVFDGDAATWVNDGNTQWYDTNHYLLGNHDRISFNIATVIGIVFATLFRLVCYRKFVFNQVPSAVLAEELAEPVTIP